ncbi:peptidase C39 family protein [Nocardioides marmoriginsengisoli]|uniref:Peptidase C39 family protein n=1 Tax=Nocardioides marmoriginsengisoli TaxID=661483 RepID=A0A3N0CT69_9ACTN|nr:C39 family peptidase [Nocardioides marmoriginsengisoli]RNL66123.1 peptidase C39 family protein [Nocardioides marmoriginsengisoli]
MRFPDPRARLARAISHPRVVVLLVTTALVLVPLGVAVHRLAPQPADTARLTATAPVPSSFAATTSDADFARGTRTGTAIGSGAVRLGNGTATRTWAGRTYEYGSWSSAWTTPARTFTRLVPSWTATTPPGSWVQVLVQVRDGAGKVSTAKDLGRWSTGDAILKRSSAGSQSDKVARVATDTVVATGRALSSYRLTVRLMRTPGRSGPVLTAVGAVTSTPATSVPPTSLPLRRTAISLAVPRYSQMTHRGQAPQYGGGGEAWCSPTSLAMVLGYFKRLPAASTYTWVPRRYADRFVNHLARLTYDHAYEGTGNWPFNTAYAATRTGNAFVTRLANLRMAERFVRAGIPLTLSIRFARGGLAGAPISSTPGHLLVLTGFTAAGNPIVNDPAAPTNASVRRTYDRAQFERAWLRGSDGMAYVVHDAAHPLPTRPRGVRNW